jgi:hypothetical protein
MPYSYGEGADAVHPSNMKAFAEPVHTNVTRARARHSNDFMARRQTQAPISVPTRNGCVCGCGCPQCRSSLPVQAKLNISQPGDAHEQEADRVANEIMAIPTPSVARPNGGVHMVQQSSTTSGPLLQRRVSPQYETISSNLSYGIFDWAITDREAREVLEILSRLSDLDLSETVAAMDRDGLVDRLLDNVTREDEERHSVLLARITRHRSTSHSAEWIVGRLSRGIFDWMITDEDARQALHALMGLESQELRTVVGNMVNEGIFDRLEEELPDEELRRFPAFLARLRSIRDEFQALVTAHVAYLRSQRDPRTGRTGAGAAVSGTVRDIGYGGSRASWDDLRDDEQEDWERRAYAAITRVTDSVRYTDLEPILSRSELVFDPHEAERLNAYAYVVGANRLFFGRGWVSDAEADPRNVWHSIAHELGGHEEFGATWSWEIMTATLRRLTPEERRQAVSDVNSVLQRVRISRDGALRRVARSALAGVR